MGFCFFCPKDPSALAYPKYPIIKEVNVNLRTSPSLRALLLPIVGMLVVLLAGSGTTLGQQGRDMGCSPTLANPCNGNSSGGSSGGSTSGGRTFLDDIGCALFGGPGCPEKPDNRKGLARELNERGVAAFNRDDYAAAVRYLEQAAKYNPDSEVIRSNLQLAKERLAARLLSDQKEREAAEKRRKEAVLEALRKNKALADNLQNSAREYARTLKASPSSDGLVFDANASTNTAKNSGKENLDFTANVDGSVVDLREARTLSVDPKVLKRTKALGTTNTFTPVRREDQIVMMLELTEKLGWTREEQERLAKALIDLNNDDGNTNLQSPVFQYVVWQRVAKRESDADLLRAAADAGGSKMPGAGTQSTNDCTVFALANAAGLPYGVVAARATGLIGDGQWRKPDQRADPESVFSAGLNGYEVIMLAESFGQAEVVKSSSFVDVLKDGRPILLGVRLAEQDAQGSYRSFPHEIVLTKSFEFRGETYFEIMDSNQPPTVRHYITKRELDTIIFESGVAFRPEGGTTVKSLK